MLVMFISLDIHLNISSPEENWISVAGFYVMITTKALM